VQGYCILYGPSHAGLVFFTSFEFIYVKSPSKTTLIKEGFSKTASPYVLKIPLSCSKWQGGSTNN
jgi:hypothetical protein